MEFVMNLTDRIVVMEFGTADGRHARRSAGQPAVRAAYLGGADDELLEDAR
jgi:branched-chain amino acid transport system permease protein